MTSKDHNVVTNATGILTVSSAAKTRTHAFESEFEIEIDPESIGYDFVMLTEVARIEPYECHLVAYIASCIEKAFIQDIKQHKYKCKECLKVIQHADDKIDDGLLAMKTDIEQPSASTLKIVIFSDAVLKIISLENPLGNTLNAVLKVIYENINMDDLFDTVNFNHNDQEESTSHKAKLVSQLIKTYLTIKSKRMGQRISDKERGELIRHRKKREVILAGQ